jgi:hypothetical protein
MWDLDTGRIQYDTEIRGVSATFPAVGIIRDLAELWLSSITTLPAIFCRI